jgi:hypothetical protein
MTDTNLNSFRGSLGFAGGKGAGLRYPAGRSLDAGGTIATLAYDAHWPTASIGWP